MTSKASKGKKIDWQQFESADVIEEESPTQSEQAISSSFISNQERLDLHYFKNRDPLKEFFLLVSRHLSQITSHHLDMSGGKNKQPAYELDFISQGGRTFR